MTLPQPPGPTTTACYRHPGREAGRRCTRCGRPACTECLVQAAVGSHCLECAKASRPTISARAHYWNARQITLVTYAVMAINIAVFVWIAIEDSSSISGRQGVTREQFDLGLFGVAIEQGEWWRLITSGFLHFGIIHIAFNMLLLFQLGQLLEPAIGRVRFALLYVAALLGGSAGALILQPGEFHGGASGAVFGLMGAAAIGMHLRGVNPFSTGIGSVLLINLFITFTLPGISIGGHLGGIVAGGLAGAVVLAPTWKGVPVWATYVAPIAVMAIAVGVSFAVA
ncbi:MAG: rhomboid family intramembrane serine protease [Acidimicrobiia bacterium]|nr:rhomboid family intramembrane serine protease [Acidimicrobiia bacterium]